MPECDLPGHRDCTHGGWQEADWSRQDIPSANAARAAADFAATDLGLDLIRVKGFGPGPLFHWSPTDPAVDRELVTLNMGPFGPTLYGKACPLNVTPLTVWVRVGLTPAATALVVLHESRHIWQFRHTNTPSGEEDEADAHRYAWAAVGRFSWSPGELRAAKAELGWTENRMTT